MKKVFICYRREDGADRARIIKEALEKAKFEVFIDIDDAQAGNYRKNDLTAMDESDKVVVILSDAFFQRCSEPNDEVFNELKHAKDSGKSEEDVINVLPYEGYRFPGDIPKEIDYISSRNGITYDHSYYESAMQRLINLVETGKIDAKEKRKRKKKTIICIILALMLALMGVFICQRVLYINKTTGKGGEKLVTAEIVPYTESESYMEKSIDKPIRVDRAFSIRSSIRNTNEETAAVTKIACDFKSIKPIEKAKIIILATIKDRTLKIYEVNNGFGTSEKLSKISSIIENDNSDLTDLTEKHILSNGQVMESGAIIECGEYLLDKEAFLRKCTELSTESIGVAISSGKWKGHLSLCYDSKADKIYIPDGGKGDGGGTRLDLAAELDVDATPQRISFNGKNSTPFIDDVLVVQTLLVPTKSCVVVCRGCYTVNGLDCKTKKFKVNVEVPVYRYDSLENDGDMVKECSEVDGSSGLQLEKIAEKYRYTTDEIVQGNGDE